MFDTEYFQTNRCPTSGLPSFRTPICLEKQVSDKWVTQLSETDFFADKDVSDKWITQLSDTDIFLDKQLSDKG